MVEISSLPDMPLSEAYAKARELEKESLTSDILHPPQAFSLLERTVEELVFTPIPSDLATLLNDLPPQSPISISPPEGSAAFNLFSPSLWDNFVHTLQPILEPKEPKRKKETEEEKETLLAFFHELQQVQKMVQDTDNRRNQYTKS